MERAGATSERYADTLQLIGRADRLDWYTLGKVHELLLEDEAGGFKGLARRSGVPQPRWDAFTMSSNDRSISQWDARHAINKGRPATGPGMTLGEAQGLVLGVLRRWPETEG